MGPQGIGHLMRALVIDGYNVLHVPGRYAELTERDLDAARLALINDVVAYAQDSYEAVVVFDGASNPRSDGSPHEVAGVTVVFSPYGRDADSVIEAEVARRRAAGQEVTIVTSDAQTQWVALGLDALRVSSARFVAMIEGHAEEGSEFSPAGSFKSTVGSRIDNETKDALSRWARGL